MKYLIIFIFFFLANCSTFTVASIATNTATYSATGKTNSDHVISLITGKDCKIFRIIKKEKICDKSNITIAALNEKKESKSIEDREDNKVIKKKVDPAYYIDAAYYITKNVIKDHAKIGARITDTIKLTNELEEKIQIKFDSIINKPKKETALIKNNIKEENIYKKDFWETRVQEEKKKRVKIKEKFLKVFKKIKLYNKDIYVSNNIR